MANSLGIEAGGSGRRETPSSPLVFESVLDRVNFHASNQPHALAIVSGDEKITYGEILTRASAVASALAAILEGKCDCPIAICTDNTYQLIIAALASWMTGCSYLPVA